MKTSLGPWLLHFIGAAWTAQTDWAVAYSAGVNCATCTIIEGTDWYAVPVFQVCQLDHPQTGSGYWVGCELTYPMVDGQSLVGMVFQTSQSGCPEFSGVSGGASCRSVDATVYLTSDGHWFGYRQYQFDKNEAVAALAPGATEFLHGFMPENAGDVCFNWTLGWNCDGSATVVLEYLIFKK